MIFLALVMSLIDNSEFTQQDGRSRQREEDGKTLVCDDKRDRAITYVLCRDPHLTF